MDNRRCPSVFTERREENKRGPQLLSLLAGSHVLQRAHKGATEAKSSGIAELKRKTLGFVEDGALEFVVQSIREEKTMQRIALESCVVFPWNLSWILRCKCIWSNSTMLGSGVMG